MKKHNFDLTIVGGGIIGTTIATLASIKYPNHSIAIVDKNLLGCGTTLYSAGLSTPLAKSINNKKLLNNSSETISLLDHYIDLNLKNLDGIYIVSKNNIEKFKSLYCGNNLTSISKEFLAPISLNKKLILPEDKVLFYAKSDSHFCNPANVVQKMAAFIKKSDRHSIFETCTLQSIKKNKDNSILLKTNLEQEIMTKNLVLALGPWLNTSSLIEKKSDCKNKKVAALHLNAHPIDNDPVIVLFDDDAFLLPIKDRNYWLYSFTSQEWNCNPTDDIRLSASDITFASEILKKYSSSLSDEIVGGRVFCDSYSENREFLIDNINDSIRVISGASGSGYRFAYGIADQLLKELQ